MYGPPVEETWGAEQRGEGSRKEQQLQLRLCWMLQIRQKDTVTQTTR